MNWDEAPPGARQTDDDRDWENRRQEHQLNLPIGGINPEVMKLFMGGPPEQIRLQQRLNTRWKHGYDPGPHDAPPVQAMLVTTTDGTRQYMPAVFIHQETGSDYTITAAKPAPTLPGRTWTPYQLFAPPQHRTDW